MPRRNEKQERLEQRIKKLSQIDPFSYTFGVEIECLSAVSRQETADLLKLKYYERFNETLNIASEGYNHRNHDGNEAPWKIVSDASVWGSGRYMESVEIVSPILSGMEGLEKFQRVYEIAEVMQEENILKVTKQCGTHIHLGTEGVPVENIRKFALNYLRSESAIDLLVPPSRRLSKNGYCSSNVRNYAGTSTRDASTSAELVKQAMEVLENIDLRGLTRREALNQLSYVSNTRYLKLNLSSLHHNSHKTIEVRQFGGTLNKEKAVGWLTFLDYMYRMSRTQVAFKKPTSDRNCEAKGNFRRLTAWLDADKKVQDWAKGRKKELEQNDARARRNARRRQRYAQNRRAD